MVPEHLVELVGDLGTVEVHGHGALELHHILHLRASEKIRLPTQGVLLTTRVLWSVELGPSVR